MEDHAVTVPATSVAPTTGDTRASDRAAIDLATVHTFAGTSLQMIADELGLTKAAIYHHFRTAKLLDAVVGPILEQLRAVVDAARTNSTPARAECLINGFAQLAVDKPGGLGARGRPVRGPDAASQQGKWDNLIDRQMAVLAAVNPAPAVPVKAAVALPASRAPPARGFANLDRDELHAQLLDAGRRVSRTARTPPVSAPTDGSAPTDIEESHD